MIRTKTTLPIYFNPLLVGIPKDRSDHKQIASNFFDFFSVGSTAANRCNQFLRRHEKLIRLSKVITALPLDDQLHEKIIKPLKQAYGNFLTGNFLPTLALCGMICEMIAILQFESSAVTVVNRNTARNERKPISSKEFESLGQKHRIQTLRESKIVDQKQADLLEKVRTIRNNHLHFWSRHHNQMENEAYQVLSATIAIVKSAFFEESDEERLLIKAEVLEYLSRKLDSSDDEQAKNWLHGIWGHREEV